ncbi:MAG: ubiquinol-cytochrome C chaperone [Roseibium sp.]|nr:ubiquinol-cytochrome C chaperone [Roseibium sp.]
MLFGLFKKRNRDAELAVYSQIVAQARQPVFYTKFCVPDTVDGRFDLILMHAVLYFRRLRGEPKDVAAFSQSVFDFFFQDMDGSLREMGISDTRVPKKVRVMGEAFYGRAEAYSSAIDDEDLDALGAAIGRNVFPGNPEPVAQMGLAHYMVVAAKHLAAQPTDVFLSGQIDWPDPAASTPKT